MNETDAEVYVMLGVIAVLLLVVLIVGLAQFMSDFIKELRYIDNEIRRTRGIERRQWIRKRRRLWMSLIPGIKY